MILKYQIIAMSILAVFGVIYLGKILSQKKQGITTVQLAKDKSDRKRYRIEKLVMISVYGILIADFASILWGGSVFHYSYRMFGGVLAILGDICFLSAVLAMGTSWRAGIAANDKRELVKRGIYKISRNPAFLGFDLVFLGILIMFFNWILLVLTAFSILMLHLLICQEERFCEKKFGEEYIAYKKKVCRYIGRRNWKFWAVTVILILIFGAIIIQRMNDKLETLADMSFEDCMKYTTDGCSDAVITVGIYRDGEATYTVYGKNGKILEPKQYTYEIGSLTKTITAALIHKAEQEGKLELSDTIDKYLDLPQAEAYPTIQSLLTHTSGYEGYYLNPQIMWNGVVCASPFRYVSDEDILSEAAKHNPCKDAAGKTYSWSYSNFGYALLGLVLENVYDEDYVKIVNDYLDELGMHDSAFAQENCDFGRDWKWELRDAYAPAGAIHSNIEDMLRYAALQLKDPAFEKNHNPLYKLEITNEEYAQLDIGIDQIGMAWIVDDTNGFVWHNGGTDYYNSYLGFCKDTDTAVAILSNLPDDYRIPATVLGAKLLKELQSE